MEQKTPDPAPPAFWEELADKMLEDWARSQLEGNDNPGDVLRRNGILNRRRIAHVHGIEVSINQYKESDEKEEW